MSAAPTPKSEGPRRGVLWTLAVVAVLALVSAGVLGSLAAVRVLDRGMFAAADPASSADPSDPASSAEPADPAESGDPATSEPAASDDEERETDAVSGEPVLLEPDPAAPVMMILDASGSMARQTADGTSRMAEARDAVSATVAALPDGAETGLLVFGTGTGNSEAEQAAGCRDVRTLAPLGPLDREAFVQAVSGVTESGFTPIGPALREAAAMLPSDGAGNIVLVSDGVDTCAPPPACEIASELRAQNPLLEIHVIGFAVDEDEEAQQQLQCIGGVGGGSFVRADNVDQLSARLALAVDPSLGDDALSAEGFRQVRLGMRADEVLAVAPGASVEERGTENDVEYVLIVCDWGRIELHDDRVVRILPDGPARTREGIALGADEDAFARLYGSPVDSGTDAEGAFVVYQAQQGSRTGYRVYVSGGVVQRIVVCTCVPGVQTIDDLATWEVDFDSFGPIRIGDSLEQVRRAVPWLDEPVEDENFFSSTRDPDDEATEYSWQHEIDSVTSISIQFTADLLVRRIGVSETRAWESTAYADGASLPHARGIRLGDTALTASHAFPDGTFFHVMTSDWQEYLVTDRRGRALGFEMMEGGGVEWSGVAPELTLDNAVITGISVDDVTTRNSWWQSVIDDASGSSDPEEPPSADPGDVVPGTTTAIVRIDPWNEYRDDASSAGEWTLDGCSRDAYRSDRIRCTASAHCFLGPDETQALCPRDVGREWVLTDVPALEPFAASIDAPVPIFLELSDGRRCEFSTGAGPDPPEGIWGWAGGCEGDVLWYGFDEGGFAGEGVSVPDLFLEPEASGKLRVAIGETEVEIAEVDTVFW